MKIKTRRGVFIRLEDSDITFTCNNKIYKFSSCKKREIFIKRVKEAKSSLSKINNKVFKYSKNFEKDFNLNGLLQGVCDKIYNDMRCK